MDQQIPDTLPSVEIPGPRHEADMHESPAQLENRTEQATAQHVEQGISVPAPSPIPPQPSQSITPIANPMVMPHDAPPAGVPGIAMTPQIADDTDLIEKEWVDKAKQIVEHTRHDPHRQNKEITIMKADYLKKRYNKDIKLSE